MSLIQKSDFLFSRRARVFTRTRRGGWDTRSSSALPADRTEFTGISV